MSGGRKLQALSALVRWRSLSETQASESLRRCNEELRRAEQDSERAKNRLADIQGRRMGMLSAAKVDLSLLVHAAAIEESAWSELQECNHERDVAESSRDTAHADYVAARARTNVVQARHDRVVLVEADRVERTEFDRMAELRVLTGRKMP